MMFMWLLIIHIICVFSSPTPKHNSYAQLSKRSIPVINDPKDWNPTQAIQIADGFKDACTLAKAGRDAATPDNPIFLKYFQADQVHIVQEMFSNIVGDDTLPGGSEQKSHPCSNLLSNFKIVRDFADEEGSLSCVEPTDLAVTRNGEEDDRKDGNELLMIICDPGLKHGGINKAYNGDENHPKGPAAVNCDTIGDRVMYRMDTLGATILHEYTDYDDISVPPLSNNPTQDENAVYHAQPETVYGPINTRKAFWTAECAKEFSEPQHGDDTDPVRADTPPGDSTAQPSVQTPQSGNNAQVQSSTSKTPVSSTIKTSNVSARRKRIPYHLQASKRPCRLRPRKMYHLARPSRGALPAQ